MKSSEAKRRSVATTIFSSPLAAGLGKRLGVPFKRAQQGEICVNIPLGNERGDSDYVLLLEQSEMGRLKAFDYL